MRWSTRLRGVGLLILLACHLVSSYHSQDYQIWDWGDRERKRIEHQPLQRQDWHQSLQRGGREYFETSAVDNTLYRGHFDKPLENENVNFSGSLNDIISATQWPDESYLYNSDDQISAEPSILGTRHPLVVNQHLDVNDKGRYNDEDSDVTSSNKNNDEEDDDEEETENTRSVNVLNVSSKDSPYALINKFFSEREDNYEGMV